MESEISHVKRARLSQNQIWEIVMDSDSDKEKNYASDSTEDGQEPRPPSLSESITISRIWFWDRRARFTCEISLSIEKH